MSLNQPDTLECPVCKQFVRGVYQNGDSKRGLRVGAHDEKLLPTDNPARKPFRCLGVGEPGLKQLEATRE